MDCGHAGSYVRLHRNFFEKLFGVKEKWKCTVCGTIMKI